MALPSAFFSSIGLTQSPYPPPPLPHYLPGFSSLYASLQTSATFQKHCNRLSLSKDFASRIQSPAIIGCSTSLQFSGDSLPTFFCDSHAKPGGLLLFSAPILICPLRFSLGNSRFLQPFTCLSLLFARVNIATFSQPDSGFLGPFGDCVLWAPVPLKSVVRAPVPFLGSLLIVGSWPFLCYPVDHCLDPFSLPLWGILYV